MSQEETSNLTTSAQHLESLCADPGQRITVANNPATPANLLERLAHDQDGQVRQAVAGNPNTPWRTLEHLAWEFPHEFLTNPVAPLQIIAYPEQIHIDDVFWEVLLRSASISPFWWTWLRNHPRLSMNRAVRLHIQAEGEITYPTGILQEEDDQTLLMLVELLTISQACSAARGDKAPGCQEADKWEQVIGACLRRLAQSVNDEVRRVVSARQQTPEDVLRLLALDSDVRVRENIARNERTPADVLQLLAYDPHAQVREHVAWYAQVAVEALSLDEDARVRKAVARHAHSMGVLYTLAHDSDVWVRFSVALNERTPEDILRLLALDADALVRSRVASHAQTPEDVLRRLALDAVAEVRREIAAHEQTPGELWKTLALDTDEYVRKAVASNRQTPTEVLRLLALDANAWVRSTVANHPQTSVDTLRLLALDQDWLVRRVVACHPQLPLEVLRTLTLDKESHVRREVVRHEKTAEEILDVLVQDKYEDVQWEAKLVKKLLLHSQERLSKEAWDTLSSASDDDGAYIAIRNAYIEEQLDMIARLNASEATCLAIIDVLAAEWDTRTILRGFTVDETDFTQMLSTRQGHARSLMTPFMPPAILQQLAASPVWEIRYLVASHAKTPQETRQCLSQDGNRHVRAMAQAYMHEYGS